MVTATLRSRSCYHRIPKMPIPVTIYLKITSKMPNNGKDVRKNFWEHRPLLGCQNNTEDAKLNFWCQTVFKDARIDLLASTDATWQPCLGGPPKKFFIYLLGPSNSLSACSAEISVYKCFRLHKQIIYFPLN